MMDGFLCKNRVSEVWIKIIFKQVEEVTSSIRVLQSKVVKSFFFLYRLSKKKQESQFNPPPFIFIIPFPRSNI